METEQINPKYVKVMLFLKRKEDCSDEKFHRHWRTHHVDLAMSNKTFASKVIRMTQTHTSPELKAEAANFGIPVMDCDGFAEVWVKSVEDWKAIVTDEEFVKAVAGDEAVFIQAPITIMFGYDNLCVGKETGIETQIKGKNI